MVEISVIVPAYNAEKYIKKCIKSCLNQQFVNYEVIAVDDGSKDSTYSILKELSKNNNKLKVFHIDNGGVSNARRVGYNNSTGRFICFVDSDDTIPTNSLTILYNYLQENDLDISIGLYTRVFPNKKVLKYKPKKIFNKDEALKDLLSHGIIAHGPVAKLFKRSLIKDDSFLNFNRGEDYLMCIDIALRTNRIGIIDCNVYNYYYRKDSAINTIKTNLDYEKKYNKSLMKILRNENADNLYSRELITFNLYQLFSIMIHSNVTTKDLWVYDIIVKASKIKSKLSNKEKIIFYAIKYPILQKCMRIINCLRKQIISVLLKS